MNTEKAYILKKSEFIPYEGTVEQSTVCRLLATEDAEKLGLGIFKFGYMRLDSFDMKRKRPYDMVFVSLEGAFSAEFDGQTLQADSVGDTIWVPQGSSVTFRGEDALVWYAAAHRKRA